MKKLSLLGCVFVLIIFYQFSSSHANVAHHNGVQDQLQVQPDSGRSTRNGKKIPENSNNEIQIDSKTQKDGSQDESSQKNHHEGHNDACEKDGHFSPFSKNLNDARYYVCNHGKKIEFQCPSGLRWNPEVYACDWPPQQQVTMPVTPNSCTSSSPYKAHDKDCSLYYWCVLGEYRETKCAAGTYWNINRCDWTCGSSAPILMTSLTTTTAANHSQDVHSIEKEETGQWDAGKYDNGQWDSGKWGDNASGGGGGGGGKWETATVQQTGQWEWEPEAAKENNTGRPLILPPSEYKMVCYFTNWATYRPGNGKYKPRDVDFNLCTHIAYAFATLNGESLTLQAYDSWIDLDNKFYRQMVTLKTWGVKVVLALGGWNDSQGDKYSRLIHDVGARKRFVETAITFLEKYGFDGLDLDWEYPVCWQNDCKRGPATDKENFAKFVQELSVAFKPRGLLLSSAVGAGQEVIDKGYDVPTLSKYLDWISVMTYDFHGQWDKQTGHVAPLYYHENDLNPTLNVNYSISYWLSKGAEPSKLVMGMPLYGQSFTVAQQLQLTGSALGLNLGISGGGEAGEFTRQSGMLAYYEICGKILKNQWSVVQDQKDTMGPIAHNGKDQWVSFDDVRMLEMKSEYIKKMRLGGGMIWALDLDDFSGNCGCGRSPLLKTINRVLRNYPETVATNCLQQQQ